MDMQGQVRTERGDQRGSEWIAIALQVVQDVAEREDVVENEAVGDQVVVFDDLRCSSRSLVEIVPSPPKATHCVNPLKDSLLLVAAWMRVRNSARPMYLSRNSMRMAHPNSRNAW